MYNKKKTLMSFQTLRQISERYANTGNRQDVDEFRAEMDRVAREQRFQTIERYINDLYYDFPYLVRNRQYQFVPARNQRLSELIQIATNQQLEAYRQQLATQQAAQNTVAAQAQADAQKRIDDANAMRQQALSVFPNVSANVNWLLIAAAALLALLLIILIGMVWQMSKSRQQPVVTVVQKKVDPDLVDVRDEGGSTF